MTKFNIENLEGKGIKAEVLSGGNQYSTYDLFAQAAGHPDAVRQHNPFLVIADHIEGETVDVIAVGDHHLYASDGKVYICRTDAGQKFIIGHKGVKIMEQPKLSEFSTDALYKEIERRAFEAGFKAGEAKVKEIPVGTPGVCDLGGITFGEPGFIGRPLSATIPKPTRDQIVELAKEDIETLIENGRELDEYLDKGTGNAFVEDYFYEVSFHVNEKKRAVTAVLRQTNTFGHLLDGGERSVGVAKCDPNDCFNEFIGKAIALHRALGLDVPADYLNAPAPEGKQHGDIVSYTDWSLSTKIIRLVDRGSERLELGKSAHVGSAVSNEGRVINDTARYK